MKKILLLIILLFLSILTSCKDYNNLEEFIPVEITFKITWKDYSGRGETVQRIVSKFNEDNHSILVVGGDENLETIKNEIDNKNIDVFVLPYRYVKLLAYEEYLLDLSQYFNNKNEDIFNKIWDFGKYDNRVYAIPWVTHSMALIYNKDLLNQAQIEPDSIDSLGSFTDALFKIKNSTNAYPIGLVGMEHNDLSWMINQFIYGFGGQLVSNDQKTVALNTSQTKDALNYYKNTLGNLAQPTWLSDNGEDVMKYFRDGKIAFEIQSLWGVTDIWKNANPFEIGVIPLNKIGIYSETGPMMIAIRNNIEKNKLSQIIDFINYMISDSSQEIIMHGEYSPEHDRYYPFRLSVKNNVLIKDNYPELYVFREGFNYPSVDVPTPLWQKVKEEVYTPYLHKLMLGEITIDSFINKVESEGNKILNENKKE